MSLSALKEIALQETQETASRIAQTSAAELAREQDAANQEMRVLEDAIILKAQREAEHQSRTIHQQATLAGKTAILRAKQEELEGAKKAFLDFLQDMSESDKKKILTSLKNSIPHDKKGEITESLEGGLLFNGDGIEINLTFPHLVEHLFWKYRLEISKELFI